MALLAPPTITFCMNEQQHRIANARLRFRITKRECRWSCCCLESIDVNATRLASELLIPTLSLEIVEIMAAKLNFLTNHFLFSSLASKEKLIGIFIC